MRRGTEHLHDHGPEFARSADVEAEVDHQGRRRTSRRPGSTEQISLVRRRRCIPCKCPVYGRRNKSTETATPAKPAISRHHPTSETTAPSPTVMIAMNGKQNTERGRRSRLETPCCLCLPQTRNYGVLLSTKKQWAFQQCLESCSFATCCDQTHTFVPSWERTASNTATTAMSLSNKT